MSTRRYPCWKVFALAALACGLALRANAVRADDAPLFQQEPFDTIKLDDENKSVVLKVFPLDLPDRKLPEKPKPDDELEIRLVDRPRKTYKVQWAHIAEVKLFEQMVLDEAEVLTGNGKFDEAYPYYEFLQRRHGQMPGLEASYQRYLFQNAGAAYKQGRLDEALGLLWQLFARDPNYKAIAPAIDHVADKLVERRIEADDYPGARGILQEVGAKLKDRAKPLVDPWTEKLQSKATEQLAQAKTDFAAGRMAEANRACHVALAAWPEITGGAELAAAIRKKYPEVFVGVTELPADAASGESDSWAVRRGRRLRTRAILELSHVRADGGDYFATLTYGSPAAGRPRVTLAVKPGVSWPNRGGPLTAADLARSLVAEADPQHPAYRPQWAALLGGVSVSAAGEVQVDLKQPVARIEPWLAVDVWPQYTASNSRAAGLGPYRLEPTAAEAQQRYVAVSDYFAAGGPGQPQEIVERRFPDMAAALRALRRGEVQVVDRVSPWDAAALAHEANLVIEPYGVHSVHLLRVNPLGRLTGNRLFRKALAHALDPVVMLRDDLSRGKLPSGVEATDWLVVAPAGAAAQTAAPADPALAKALVQVALEQTALTAQARGEKPLPAAPPLVLAHPADDAARVAAQAIQRQLRAAGLTVQLKELTAGSEAAAADADLQYVEWTPLEPVLDLPQLLGKNPRAEALLGQLAAARTAEEAAERLRDIQQLLHDESLVIPLWRLPLYLARGRDLQGVGVEPITLYQNVEKWRLTSAEANEK